MTAATGWKKFKALGIWDLGQLFYNYPSSSRWELISRHEEIHPCHHLGKTNHQYYSELQWADGSSLETTSECGEVWGHQASKQASFYARRTFEPLTWLRRRASPNLLTFPRSSPPPFDAGVTGVDLCLFSFPHTTPFPAYAGRPSVSLWHALAPLVVTEARRTFDWGL
ncbi:hypothetical protein BDZ97DRAFT_1021350 [Flammula alnicola]|nr:hypothetical protein BDZ97DRAFT_1021350 [Flammula alnicola]